MLNVDVPAAAAGGGTVITVHGRDFSPYATFEWADGLPGPSFTVTDRSPTSFAVLLGSGSAGGLCQQGKAGIRVRCGQALVECHLQHRAGQRIGGHDTTRSA